MKQRSVIRWGCLIVVLLMTVCALSGCGGDTEEALAPTNRFFVNDFAGVLSQEAENDIYARGVKLQQDTKAEGAAQAVVVTVKSLEGQTIENYAYKLASSWGIGDEERDSGLLILLAVEEREIRIEVGNGLQGQITDGKTGRILNTYAIPDLKQDNFSAALQKTYAAVVNEIYHEYGMATDEGYVPANDLPGSTGTTEGELPPWMAVVALVGLVALVIWKPQLLLFIRPGFGGGGRGGHGGGGGFSGGGGGFSGGGASRGF